MARRDRQRRAAQPPIDLLLAQRRRHVAHRGVKRNRAMAGSNRVSPTLTALLLAVGVVVVPSPSEAANGSPSGPGAGCTTTVDGESIEVECGEPALNRCR
jgi:hypothetical protein